MTAEAERASTWVVGMEEVQQQVIVQAMMNLWSRPAQALRDPEWHKAWRKAYTPVERYITNPDVLPRLWFFGHASRSAFLCRPEHLYGLSNALTGAQISSIPIFTDLPDVLLNLGTGAGSNDGETSTPPVAMVNLAQLRAPRPISTSVHARMERKWMSTPFVVFTPRWFQTRPNTSLPFVTFWRSLVCALRPTTGYRSANTPRNSYDYSEYEAVSGHDDSAQTRSRRLNLHQGACAC